MNMMKKIATLILAVCLVVPCFSMLTHAANGKVMFTDPTTAVGETLELKGVIEAGSAIEDRTIVMSYDTNMLRFTSGDHTTETAEGQLTYEVKGGKSGTRVEFLMYFEVLQEGTATVKAESAAGYTTTNQKITWTSLGSSKITINPGQATAETTDEPTTDAPATDANAIVDIDGVSYTFSDEIPSDEIPEGFTSSTLEYAGSQHRIVVQESTGIKLGYLVDADGQGKFFMYVEENATFVPFEQIEISKTTVITILSYVENITLPEPYVLTTVTINEVEFPAWQNSENTELCILYALNAAGEKAFYQFDTAEDTYQRFEIPTVEVEEDKDTSLVGELNEMLGEHLDYVILGVGLGLILFVIIIIVLSVKLYNRNAELDEIYDEYGIGLDNGDKDDVDDTDNDEDDDEESDRFVYIGDDEDEDDIVEEVAEVESNSSEKVEVPEVKENTVQEETVETNNVEVEDDIFFEEVSGKPAQTTKDMVELDFDILFADETEKVANAVESDLFDEDDELDHYNDNDTDFEISFLDLDD